MQRDSGSEHTMPCWHSRGAHRGHEGAIPCSFIKGLLGLLFRRPLSDPTVIRRRHSLFMPAFTEACDLEWLQPTGFGLTPSLHHHLCVLTTPSHQQPGTLYRYWLPVAFPHQSAKPAGFAQPPCATKSDDTITVLFTHCNRYQPVSECERNLQVG